MGLRILLAKFSFHHGLILNGLLKSSTPLKNIKNKKKSLPLIIKKVSDAHFACRYPVLVGL